MHFFIFILFYHSIIFTIEIPTKIFPEHQFVNASDKRYNVYVKNTLPQNDILFMRTIILMVVLYAWITVLAAILGIFYPLAIFGVWFVSCIALYIKKALPLPRPSRHLTIYIVIAASFTFLIALFTVPTIFAGRDQGSLATAAIQLTQDHMLISQSPESTAFFDIYGRGKALNFPGFHYLPDGSLLTQFPLPYITFISGFFGSFGILGLIIANSVLLFLFILSTVCTARTFLHSKHTYIFIALFLSSFVVGWFGKFTLSENIAGTLLWSSIFLLIALRTQTNRATYNTFLLTITLLLFTRVEGIWFFAILFYLAGRTPSFRAFLSQDLWQRIFLPAAILFSVAFTITIMNQPFITTMAHALLDTATDSSTMPMEIAKKYHYLAYIYGIYGLLTPLLFTLCTMVFALRYKKYRPIMIICIIVAPLFLYYFYPQISGDHPWMLRRFVFALAPATILISVFGIAQIRTNIFYKKALVWTSFFVLFICNMPAFLTYLTYAENTTLLTQVHELSRTFGPNDLILVDKNVAGNGWSMITTPLRSLDDKHAVYFFNPHDLDKIDRSPFDRTFLITPAENTDRYLTVFGNRMQYIARYALTIEQLHIATDKKIPQFFPTKDVSIVSGMIYEIK